MKLTIVIPAFQPSDTLSDFFHSALLELSNVDSEFIIVDDCSGAAYNHIFDALPLRLGRDRLIRLRRNKGANFARGLGYRVSSGDYIIFHDADDSFERGRYNEIVSKLSNAPDLLYGPVRYIKRSPSNGSFDKLIVPVFRSGKSGDLLFWYNASGTGFQTSSLVMNRNKVRGFFWPIRLRGHQD